MGIKLFEFCPRLTEAFLHFGYDHYRTDRRWIPPLQEQLRLQLRPDFPFYEKPGNRHRHFLAFADGQVVGRISAFVNDELHDRDGTPVGTVGFFECINRFPVAQELLDAAVQWLSDQKIKRIWGPMNFDIWHGYRFMTKGFDEKLFLGEPYNKPFYPEFFERYGFAARQSWYSYETSGRADLEKLAARGASRYRRLVENGYLFLPLEKRAFPSELAKLHSVLSASFQNFLGFTPISQTEFEQLFASTRAAINPRLFAFAYDENKKLAGFTGIFLEISDAVRAMRGKADWAARLRFVFQRRRVNRVLFHIGGITPEEIAKRSGLGWAGFHHIVCQVLNEGYTDMINSLVVEDSPVWGLLGKRPSQAQRQYTLYELNR